VAERAADALERIADVLEREFPTPKRYCQARRAADGAPCTLEPEHLGQPHSYAGVPFYRVGDE